MQSLRRAGLLSTGLLGASAVLAVALSCSSGADPPGTGSAPEALSQPDAAASEEQGAFSLGADPPEAGAPGAEQNAEPQTALGRLRARYFPKWSSELDWAFPPEVCKSAWELDAIAAPTDYVDSQVLGDAHKAAALAVMRYELLTSRALFEPSVLSQVCVATVALPPARTTNLEVLASYIDRESRRAETPNHPEAVEIIAEAPAAVLAVACVKPGYATVLSADGEVLEQPQAPARLQTYMLALASGQEDQVADVTLRVSRLFHRPADSCEELLEWVGEWRLQVEAWIAEGQLWYATDVRITEEGLCTNERRAEDCPRNWT